MTRASQSQLHLVEAVRAEETPEEALAVLVPELVRLEAEIRLNRALIDLNRRKLAKKRGVTFIREEHVRREFGR